MNAKDINVSLTVLYGHHLYIICRIPVINMYAKFKDHRTSGSKEEAFKGFYHMGMAATLVL